MKKQTQESSEGIIYMLPSVLKKETKIRGFVQGASRIPKKEAKDGKRIEND